MPLSEETRQLNFRIESLERLLTKQFARHSQHSIVGTNLKLAKTTIAHNKDATETVDFYSGTTKGAEATTGVSVEAYNRFADLETGKWCIALFIDGGWELIAGEC